MKLFSVANVAVFVCIVAVSAVASPPAKPLLELPIDEIVQKLENVFEKGQCVAIITKDAVGDAKLQQIFLQLKDVWFTAGTDFVECASGGTEKEIHDCEVEAVKYVEEAMKKIYMEDVPKGAVEKVLHGITSECLKDRRLPELIAATKDYLQKLDANEKNVLLQ